MPVVMLRYPDLRKKGVPYTRQHLDRLEKAGLFPRRVHLSTRCVVWVEAEIEAHLKAKMADREVAA